MMSSAGVLRKPRVDESFVFGLFQYPFNILKESYDLIQTADKNVNFKSEKQQLIFFFSVLPSYHCTGPSRGS